MLSRAIITIHLRTTQNTQTLCEPNAEFLNVGARGTYSNNWGLKTIYVFHELQNKE
jgi:hypothetical protein